MDSKGREVFIIRRSVSGKRYDVSTRASTETAAVKQLERFMADPENYDPKGVTPDEPLYLTEELAQQFLDWSKEKGNSQGWRWVQKWCLEWWGEQLAGKNLRRLSLRDDINPCLAEKKNRHHRIAVLKALFGWLRKVRYEISTAVDPTFGRLSVPQSAPAQWHRSKVISEKDLAKALKHLTDPRWKDVVLVLSTTGWHVSELLRFAQSGEVEKYTGKVKGVAGVLLSPKAKAGDALRTAVGKQTLAAAKRVRLAGGFDRNRLLRDLREASELAKVEPIKPGSFRHTAATQAVQSGADVAQVSAFLNHRDQRTTRRFYATMAAVPPPAALLR
ncbi:MAG: tyrosine-type recombinase/integrase [Myxococcaceae bacterium]